MTAEETLANWNHQLESVRVRMLRGGGKPGSTTPAAVADKSGIEFLQAWLAGELPYPPICDTLDFTLVEVDAGKVVFQRTPQFK